MIAWHDNYRAVMSRYGFGVDSDAKCLCISENATWLITSADGRRKLVLRLHRPGYRSLAEIRSELAWLASLELSVSVRTPVVVPTVRGETLAILPLGDEEQYAVAFEFVEGVEPDESQSLALFFELGRAAAAMHLHAENWKAPAGFSRRTWNEESIFGADCDYGDWRNTAGLDEEGLGLLEQVEAKVRAELAAYGCAADRFGFVHYDMRLPNLLVSGDTLNVIDFDDCGYSWFMSDAANAVTFIEAHELTPTLLERWVEGYATIRPLTREDIAIIPALVMARRLQMVAWVQWRSETVQAELIRDTYVPDSLVIGRAYLAGEFLDLAGVVDESAA